MAEGASVVDIRSASRALGDKTPPVRIYLLGAMRMVGPGGENILPRLRKSRALLAYLCLADGIPVTRSSLIGLLWALSSDTQARFSLRQALSEIKRTVSRKVPELLEIDRETIRLNTGACWIDVPTGQDHAERLLEDLQGVTTAFDQWLMVERTRLENQQRASLEGELDRLVEVGAAPKLRIEAARRAVNYDPTHEVAARCLMSAFVEIGDRSQALREYERCRVALKNLSEDLTPSPETVSLYESIRLTRARVPVTGRTVGEAGSSAPQSGSSGVPVAVAIGRGSRPSIAVLPFHTFSDVPEHTYAADGVVDDLSEALSRLPNFFVTSRLSARAFRGQDRPPQEIGDLLGVQYVLSGSIRVVTDRLRLSVELTDSRSGTVLWSQRLDEKFFDLFEVQDRLVEAIVRRIAPHLHQAELSRTRIKRADRLEAYDLLLRGVENMHNSSRTVFEASERLFGEAIERQPGYAAALAWLAYWHVLRVGQGWSANPAADTARADELATRGVEYDATEPMALAVHGHIASYLHKNFDLAFTRFKAALDINPNSAPAWLWQAAARSWVGDGPRAIADVTRAKALSPYDPLMYAYSIVEGMAFLADGQYDRAVECARRSIHENRTYTSAHRLLVMALVLAGREDEAQAHVDPLLQLEPELTVERFRSRYPGSASAHAGLYCDALARAGIPLGA
jgi:TolB-like protein/DNA-binding SARP family transcriptional activator